MEFWLSVGITVIYQVIIIVITRFCQKKAKNEKKYNILTNNTFENLHNDKYGIYFFKIVTISLQFITIFLIIFYQSAIISLFTVPVKMYQEVPFKNYEEFYKVKEYDLLIDREILKTAYLEVCKIRNIFCHFK